MLIIGSPCNFSIIPNLAVKLNIPLVIWGENPLHEYGGSGEEKEITSLNREFLRKHDILKGKELSDWIDYGLDEYEVQSMVYPSDKELKKLNYTPIFLGYYLYWDSQKNRDVAVSHGFKVRKRGQ